MGRKPLVIGAMALVVISGCAGTGATGDGMVPAAAFTTATYNTVASRFDPAAADAAMHAAYPDGEPIAFETAIEIATAACAVAHYEKTADGRSAVYALRQTEHGSDVIAIALAAGCSETENAAAFVDSIDR